MPGLALALGTPRVRGATAASHDGGTIWTPRNTRPRSLVVYFTTRPASARWIAGSLAERVNAAVFVPDSADEPVGASARSRQIIDSLKLDSALTVVIGEDDGARSAVAACPIVRAVRLALISPPPMADTDLTGIPTTLLQASRSSKNRREVVALDGELRRAGIAVRETEYESIADGWARYPRAVSGSGRALDDLIAFLERGIGTPSTFDVIPGWDLH